MGVRQFSGPEYLIRTAHERGPEAESSFKDEALEREAKLLRWFDASLHELSQPMTVLLCALDYGFGSNSAEEMREMVGVSQEACERLRTITATMQANLRKGIEERAASGRALS